MTVLHAERALVPTVRRVTFDLSKTPLHWAKQDDPMLTHFVNVLHLLLPAGERWFLRVFKQALPRISDERLRAQVKGFMGQEGTHASAHVEALDHMRAHGLDPSPFVQRIEFIFEKLLSEDTAPRTFQGVWLEARLAAVAAIEHYTSVLGQWFLDADIWDRIGADPVMLDIIRWHAAEEIEHRAVAFDAYEHVCGNRALRNAVMGFVAPEFGRIWLRGARFLMENDPTLSQKERRAVDPWREWGRLGSQGLIPRRKEVFVGYVARYLRKDFHPLNEGSTARAHAYLATSKVVRRAP